VLLYLCSFCSIPYVASQTDLETDLRTRYEQKVFMLRNFYQDDHLEFDSTGSAKGKVHTGAWTIGRVGISKIRLRPDRLELEGVRVADVYDIEASKFTCVRTSQKVRIEVDRNPQKTASLDDALSRVFLADSEKLADLVPAYWKAVTEGRVEAVPRKTGPPFYRIREPKPESQNRAVDPIDRVGKDVTAPVPVYTPDPHYVPLARKASFQGTTLLWAVITKRGSVGDVQVLRPVGFGIDDAAIETVKTWTFNPALKNGEPIAVQINVEVNYRLR